MKSALAFKNNRLVCYAVAILAVAAGLLLRLALTAWVGPGLATYITFYPAVMVVALFGGLVPGLVATAATVCATVYWILPTRGFAGETLPDTVGLIFFSCMGIFMSLVAERYRRTRQRAAAYEKELALRESQEELRRQREWLRVTLNSIGDAVIASNLHGRVMFLNPGAAALTGWTREEAYDQPMERVFQILNQDTRQPGENLVARVLREKGVITLADQTALIAKDGREILIENSAAPILDAAGAVAGVVLVFHDVTAKRRAEAALRESEERLRLLGNNLPESAVYQYVHETDGSVRFLYFSAGIERLTGVSVEDVLRDAGVLTRQVPPEHMARLIEAEARSARDLSDFDMELPMRRPDGQVRWMRLHSRPQRKPDGRVIWDGVQIDITESKQAEENLRESQAKLALALRSASMGAWRLDLADKKRHFDEQVCRCLGINPASFGGTAEEFYAAVHPDDRAGLKANIARTLEKGAPYQVEYRSVWPDGSVHHISTRGRLTRDAAGQPQRIDGLLWDITSTKQKEEELRRLNRTLAALSNSDQALLRATDEVEYLQEVCRIVVEDCQHAMLWVGFAEEDEAKTVRPVAHAGFEDGYLETLNVTWADTERGRGPTGTAIRTGKPALCTDMLTAPQFAPWREQALKRGYASSVVLPLMADGKAFAAMTIYSKQTDAFSEEEVKLLTQLADDLAYGVSALRLRAAHARAEARTAALARLGLLLTTAPDPLAAARAIADTALEFFNWDACSLSLYDRASDTVTERLNIDSINGRRTTLPSDLPDELSPFLRRVMDDGPQLILRQIPSDAAPMTQRFGDTLRVSLSLMFVPIRFEHQGIGVLSIQSYERNSYTPRDLETLQGLADHCAGALARLRAEKDRQHAQELVKKANRELEQRVAERTAEARGSEARYRSLVTASAQIVWLTDTQGQVVTELPTWQAFTGQTSEESKGAGWTKCLHREDRERSLAVWSEAVTNRSSYETEYRVRRSDGQYRHMLARGVPVFENDGTIREWVGTCTDITEEREIQQRRDFTSELLALFARKTSAKDYLASVVEIIRQWTGCQAMGIRVKNEKQEIPYEAWAGFEPGFLELEKDLSLERDQCFCIRAVSQICEEQERAVFTAGGSFRPDDVIAFSRYLPPEKMAHYRHNCAKFGFASLAVIPIRYREEVIAVLHLADRRTGQFPLASIEFIESMTPLVGEALHRFKTEAELAEHRDHLGELVRQRTSELEAANARLKLEVAERQRTQETLERTAENLTRSNNDLEQFAYVASHDLQEPLRAVIGFTEMLKRHFPEIMDAKARSFIAGTAEGANRMERLITDLLTYSRVGTGGGTLLPTDVGTALNEALQNLEVSIKSSQATVTSEPLPTLPVDAVQIMQLFQNLISNAIKFRGQSPPQIHVGVRREDRRWVFSVRDNGIGIGSQYFERIFQVFQRLHTRDRYPGTGIGLAICKKIVERHGGTIWIESQPGQGSVFYFSLPADPATEGPRPQSLSSS